MPTSSQHSPNPHGQGRDVRGEDLEPRFTAVNSYSVSPSPVSAYPPRSFAFRPDTTVHVEVKKDLDSLQTEPPSETSNPDASLSPTLVKRKRSPSDLYSTGTQSASTPKKLDRYSSPLEQPKENMVNELNRMSSHQQRERQLLPAPGHEDPASKADIALEHLEIQGSTSASPMNLDDDLDLARERSEASDPRDSIRPSAKQVGKRRFAHRTKTGCATYPEPPRTATTSKEWSETPRSLPPLWPDLPGDRERREQKERQKREAREEELRKMRQRIERPDWIHPDHLPPLKPESSRQDRSQPGRTRPIDSPMVPSAAELLREQQERDRLASAARYGQAIAPAISSSSRPIIGAESSHALPTMSHRKATPNVNIAPRRLTEKERMLTGQPYLHWHDPELTLDRKFCQRTVEQFNRLSSKDRAVNLKNDFSYDAERAGLFRAIFDPRKRRRDQDDSLLCNYDNGHPIGSVGESVMVDAPFTCEYGYNIHIGDEVALQAGVMIQDPCRVSIGDRCVIGPGVKMYGMTLSTDPQERHGKRSAATGGPIVIEEDVFVGPNVIILSNLTIGKGSTVVAGTVVHEDVPPDTIVAGNPMKVLRGVARAVDKGKQIESDPMRGLMLDTRGIGLSSRLGPGGSR
ncbi:hypothetical protein MBLNU457_3799t1 [Dothideomycetes sp. NU457]